MEIYSLQFLLLLVVALFIYYTVGKKQQWICLLVVSALFYLWTGSGNLCFILITGFTTWFGAKRLTKLSNESVALKKDKTLEPDIRKQKRTQIKQKQRAILFAVLIINFGILAYIKYWGDILGGILAVLHMDASTVPAYELSMGLLLPLGISFYTFQSMGYLIDVYNEKYEAEANFAKFMLFVSFFPQMIQGPINRFDKMKAQFFTQHSFCWERMERGLYRFFYGVFKKYAIANVLAPIISVILDNENGAGVPGIAIVFGILLYSIQQYADFSGGIDMVMGIAMQFDVEMQPNFRQPYFSTSLAEFWRRWHISLGGWMRDYIFYPFALTKPIKKLGKWANSKFGKHIGRVLPAMLGNILVFFVVGVWHGARLHYVLWGLYNGVIIALSDLLAPVYAKLNAVLHINTESKAFHVFRIVRTFLVVNIGWYFDRIENINTCLYYMIITVKEMQLSRAVPYIGGILADFSIVSVMLALLATCFVFYISVLQEKKIDVYSYFHSKPLVVRWGMYYAVIFLILLSFFSVPDASGFMYAYF